MEGKQEFFSHKGYSVYKYALDRSQNREIARNATKEVFQDAVDWIRHRPQEEWTEQAIDRLLIRKTRDYCDSFLDLTEIQSELFGTAEDTDVSIRPEKAPEPSPEPEAVSPSFAPQTSSPAPSEPSVQKSPSPSEPFLYTDFTSPVPAVNPRPLEAESAGTVSAMQQEQIFENAVSRVNPPPLRPSVRLDEETFPQAGFPDTYSPNLYGPRHTALSVFCIILLLLFILVLLWAIGGILMDIGWIPEYDLGYSWFNENVFALF